MRIARLVIWGLLGIVAMGLLSSCVLGIQSRANTWPLPSRETAAEGQLSPCPKSPNCVSSQSPESDEEHYIQALSIEAASREAALEQLKYAIWGANGSIRYERGGYLASIYISKIYGYVDDTEFILDDTSQDGRWQVQVRSASRVGYGDGGVNRKRIESIRQLLGKN